MRSIEPFATHIGVFAHVVHPDDWAANNEGIVLLSPSRKLSFCSGITVVLQREVAVLETQSTITTGKLIGHCGRNFRAIKPKRRARSEVVQVKIAAIDGNRGTSLCGKTVCSHRGILLVVEHSVHRLGRVLRYRHGLCRTIQVVEACFSINHSIFTLPIPVGIFKYRSIVAAVLRCCCQSKESKQKRESEFVSCQFHKYIDLKIFFHKLFSVFQCVEFAYVY